jgi:hypothetical protein
LSEGGNAEAAAVSGRPHLFEILSVARAFCLRGFFAIGPNPLRLLASPPDAVGSCS